MADQQNDVSWAIQILEAGPTDRSFLVKNWHPIVLTGAGLTISYFTNWYFKRPVFAGIQRYIIFGCAGFGIGTFLKIREREQLGRRLAGYKDYVLRHPEDFPQPERRKYKDIFKPWTPIR